MKRVMVIGCGAGKSTFSKRLHSITKIEVIHLDQYYWKPNWVESNTEEWTKTAEALIQKEEWIMAERWTYALNEPIPLFI